VNTEYRSPNGRSRLEEIGANRDRLEREHLAGFNRTVPLQIYEIEDFPLTVRKCCGGFPNQRESLFTIHTSSWIRGINLARRTRGRQIMEQ
jgi:hypothetical protein